MVIRDSSQLNSNVVEISVKKNFGAFLYMFQIIKVIYLVQKHYGIQIQIKRKNIPNYPV